MARRKLFRHVEASSHDGRPDVDASAAMARSMVILDLFLTPRANLVM